jgi:acyl carrier protein
VNISHRNNHFALATRIHAGILRIQAVNGAEMRFEAARTLIAEHLAVSLESVADDAIFAVDLGADSLDMVELAMRFEDELNIVIDDDESEICVTVGDALALLARKTSMTA